MASPISVLPRKSTLVGYEGRLLELPADLDATKVARGILRATSLFGETVLTVAGQGLRLGNVVGAIDTGDIQLEVLPKIRATSSNEEDRQFMLNLLASSGLAPKVLATHAATTSTSLGLLERITRMLSEQLWRLLSAGVPRRYAERSEILPLVRGRIEMGMLARRLPGRDHEIPVRYAPLQHDNDLSRLILALATRLRSATSSAATRALLLRCEGLLSRVERVSLGRELVQRVQTNQYEMEWNDVVEFARALVNDCFPNVVEFGPAPFFGLLFKLPELFEACLRRAMVRTLGGTGITLAYAPLTLNLLKSVESGDQVLRLKPDFLLADSADPLAKRLVADAKWKGLEPGRPGLGLQPSDVYQLATYMARHELGRGLLFFPRHEGMGTERPWARTFTLVGGDSVITVGTVDTAGLVSLDGLERARAEDELRALIGLASAGAAAPA